MKFWITILFIIALALFALAIGYVGFFTDLLMPLVLIMAAVFLIEMAILLEIEEVSR